VTDDGKLLPAQLANWKRLMSSALGLPSWFLKDEEVQQYRDKVQRDADQRAAQRAEEALDESV